MRATAEPDGSTRCATAPPARLDRLPRPPRRPRTCLRHAPRVGSSLARGAAVAVGGAAVRWRLMLFAGAPAARLLPRGRRAAARPPEPDYAPLPAPMPAGEGRPGLAARSTRRRPAGAGTPQHGRAPRAAAAVPRGPRRRRARSRGRPRADARSPDSTPPPRYPPQALRAATAAPCWCACDIGPDGVPTSVEVAQQQRLARARSRRHGGRAPLAVRAGAARRPSRPWADVVGADRLQASSD